MKKLFISFIILMFCIQVFSQKNNLVVFSENGEEFLLFVNSVQQNDKPAANVKAKDISGETIMVRVAFNNKSIPDLTKTIWTENQNVEISAMIVNKNGKYVLRPMGETPKGTNGQVIKDEKIGYEDPGEPVNSQTGSNVNVTTTTVVKENNTNVKPIQSDNISVNTQVQESGMNINSNTGGENISINVSGSDESEVIDINFSLGEPQIQTSSTTITTTTITTTGTVNEEVYNEQVEESFVPVPTGSSRCSYPMSDLDFKDAMESINSKSFEDSKLTTAKQICKSSCMTAEQIRDINKSFGFEETRLEFAKYAYDYVYDASKYYKVNDSFEFELTIEELDEYLQTK
ncbi:MAG TPA: DUF4476 domain-containing protein [Bacteroidales bacterium]|nr:DUF4476 domain-containing protein [Bacteroidales bacterium]